MSGSPYTSSGGSSSSPYVSSGSGGGGSHGGFGFIKNLVSDIGNSARGLPEGVVQLAEHPVRTGENMGKATWQTWSPLFHGDLGKFGHQFYDHPLAPLLDIATVFTGGASLAAKAGVGLERAGLISEDASLAKLGKMPKTMELHPPKGEYGVSYTKSLPKNPIYNKASRSLMEHAANSPFVPNWFSASKAYEKAQAADWAGSGLAHKAQIAAAIKLGDVVNKAGHSDLATLESQLVNRSLESLHANAPEMPLAKVMANGEKAPKGFDFLKDGINPAKPLEATGFAKSGDQLIGHIQKLGEHLKTSSLRDAHISTNADGVQVVKLVHNAAARATFLDGARSLNLLTRMARYPTAVWKYALIGLSPRTVIDNSVGNWLMYTMRQGGAHGFQGFVDAVRYTKGEKAALRMVKETGQLPDKTHFLTKHFGGEMANTFGGSMQNQIGKMDEVSQSGLSKAYQHSLYPIVHKVADVPVRAASISAFLRGEPVVKDLMKQGHKFEDAADIAVSRNPALRDRAIAHARTVAGNYISLSKGEQTLRDFVPFYLWDKHIMMHVGSMVRDRPGVLAAGSPLGQEGAKVNQKLLGGGVPSWMVGSIPFPVSFPGEGGRTSVLNTTGLNPYSTVPDIAALAQAITTGHTEDKPADTILSTVNPLISNIIQQTMGTKATGAPVTQSYGGVLPSALVDIFNSLPPVDMARQVSGLNTPGPGAKSPLYRKDWHTLLSSRAGFPIQEVDLAHAKQLAKQIANGGKKPKKSGSPYR